MKKFALGQFGHPDLILFSFLLFFFCFIGVVIWALSKTNKEHFKTMSELPLNTIEGDHHE
ncbi:MAG: CcoQ/FixQ family Cbb3-type cytochrome c oxidase assembly chaperone [Bdellovibrionales bacterium]